MKNLRVPDFLIITMLILACAIPATASPKKSITIGVIFDGIHQDAEFFMSELKIEVNRLLGASYQVNMSDERLINANWKVARAREGYQQLVKDSAVDIIVGLGILTGSTIAMETAFPKPVIAIGLLDPVLYGLPAPLDNQSGVNNLTYAHFNQSFARDLINFHEVYQYKKLGVIHYSEFSYLKNLTSKVLDLGNNLPGAMIPVPVEDSLDPVINALNSGVDAVYVGQLGPATEELKPEIIKLLIDRKIPSFADSIVDVEKGLLVGISPEEDMVKVIRRIALNIEAIASGRNASELPVNLSFKEQLTINMATARKIGLSPRFAVLGKAELLHQYDLETSRSLDLVDVMVEALNANLDIRIQDRSLASSREDLSRARTSFFPSIELSGMGTIVEKEVAESSMGQQAERTISGSATVSQLVFSEEAMGNITVQKHLVKGEEHYFEQVRREILLNAAEAYFNVLQAKTFRTIARDDVKLTRENLQVAKKRQSTGLSGMGDVYRWESELAIAVTDLIEAEAQLDTAKYNLNRLLDRPINETYVVEDVSLEDNIYKIYVDRTMKDLIDDPASLEITIQFFVNEAMDHSMEIAQIDANIAAIERAFKSDQLKRFVPSLALQGEVSHTFDRSGAGADIPGVEYDDDTWNIAASLSLPIFSGGATTVDIRQRRVELEKLRIQREQLIRLVEFNIRDAMQTVGVKEVNLTSSARSSEFARKSLELTQDNYENGTVSIVDLISAQNSALTAQASAINSTYEYIISLINVESIIGNFMLLGTPQERLDFATRLRTFAQERMAEEKGI